jgi:hypothetical protein
MGNLVVTSDMPPPSGYAGEAASRPVERREHIACPRQSWAIFSSFQRLSSELRTLNRLLNRLDHDVMLKVTGILTSSSSAYPIFFVLSFI